MKEYLTVAKIVKPQGIRGEVKVITYTDSPEVLKSFTAVYIGGNPYKLLAVRAVPPDSAIISLGGICDRNAAELLRGAEVSVLRSDAPVPPEGRYYIEDVLGCTLYSGEREVGTIVEITPARTDIYRVEREGKPDVVFPAADGVIVVVDIPLKRVTADPVRFAQVAMEER